MTSFEKKVAALLGVLIFSALFYFIYSSLKLGPVAPEPDDAALGDYDYTIEGEPVIPENETAAAAEPVAPVPPPVAPPAKKK